MGKKVKNKAVIRELPAKIKVIRQLTEQERKDSSSPSGLEKKEEEIEREISTFSNPPSPNSNFLLQSNATPQQPVRTTGNTSIQQRPQEDSDAVKKWYAQSTHLTPGRDEDKYRVPFKRDFAHSQSTTFNQSTIGRNKELQNLGSSSPGDDDKYSLVKPEKKTTRRYPWEV